MNGLSLPLTEYEQNLFDALISKGVPAEWAWLIVERDDGFFYTQAFKERNASRILMASFSWNESPEGSMFWSDVFEAFQSEEEYKDANT